MANEYGFTIPGSALGVNNDATDKNAYSWQSRITGKDVDKALEASFNAEQAQKERDFNQAEAEKARNFNAEQAQLARDFEERMSNTAYQRAMADAQKAGINILNATNQQASTPSGASAQASPATSGRASINTGENNGFANLLKGVVTSIVGVATGNHVMTAKGVTETVTSITGKKGNQIIKQTQNYLKQNY